MFLKCCQEAGLKASEISAACTQDRCVDCFDLDAAIKNFVNPVLLANLTAQGTQQPFWAPLSGKATAHERILSAPREFKKGFSSSLTSP
jgi:hypothetical protein